MPKPVLTIEPPYTPELLPVVQYAIEGHLRDGGDVFEYGSGYSTVWLAGMANVTAVEHDREWRNETRRALRDAERKATLLLREVPDMAQTIDGRGMFDLVLVDCYDKQRNAAVEAAMEHVKPGGWLVLDDSHWPMLIPSIGILARHGWHRTTVSGLHTRKTGFGVHHETSIYRRPANA